MFQVKREITGASEPIAKANLKMAMIREHDGGSDKMPT